MITAAATTSGLPRIALGDWVESFIDWVTATFGWFFDQLKTILVWCYDQIDMVLSNSFGFGGTNATLVFQRHNG